jgi:DNA mismatch repair protein MutS2
MVVRFVAMERRGEELLEFDEVRRRLADRCATSAGHDLALAITAATEAVEVRRRHRHTAEALELRRLGIAVPAGIADVRPAAKVAERGGVLDVDSLGEVLGTTRGMAEVVASVTTHAEVAPLLSEIATQVEVVLLEQLATEVDRALDGHGGVRDEASIELAQTRRALAGAKAMATEVLRSAAQRARQHLQEGFITERAGRPVLAVKASSRSAVAGIVHDRSASGQTVFIEPLDVVEANNRVRELEAGERIEIERVLAALSRSVGDVGPSLTEAVERIAQIDGAVASATLSRDWDGCEVQESDGDVALERARHPLLDPATAVPIDLPLSGLRALVVSGPNAGGKTVALKTLGILALINQCGIRPPAAVAILPVFDRVLVDIGDDQSIERSLSTFSGHVRRLQEILAAAGPRSLVLLDEVAAGTDPGEGAAIARAVLEALVDRGGLVLATTHHHELKEWASATATAANAAVGFDAEQLVSTFSIRVGEPGASHAIEVAARLGLDAGVLDAARRSVGEERGGVETLLQEAAAARVAAESERDAAFAERDEAARVRREVEHREAELAARIERMRKDTATARARAREEARDELAALQTELGTFRRELSAARREERLRVTGAAASDAERDRRLGAAAEAAARAGRSLAEATQPSQRPAELAVGDRVLVADLGVRGEVIAIEGDIVEIQGPSARLRLDVTRIVRDGLMSDTSAPRAHAPEARPIATAVPYELDVRGQRADAACAAVRAHVDAAAIAGLETVRIIHGRGTGALRAAIREELTRHPLVARSELGGPDEGGDGATIGTLR